MVCYLFSVINHVCNEADHMLNSIMQLFASPVIIFVMSVQFSLIAHISFWVVQSSQTNLLGACGSRCWFLGTTFPVYPSWSPTFPVQSLRYPSPSVTDHPDALPFDTLVQHASCHRTVVDTFSEQLQTVQEDLCKWKRNW
jgi:hypothetical protein